MAGTPARETGPVGAEDALVAQGVVLAAEAAHALVGGGLAVQAVLGVVDGAGVVARVLEERADERLESLSRKVSLAAARSRSLSEVTIRPARGSRGQRAVLAVADAVVGSEEPELVLDEVAAKVDPVVLSRVKPSTVPPVETTGSAELWRESSS